MIFGKNNKPSKQLYKQIKKYSLPININRLIKEFCSVSLVNYRWMFGRTYHHSQYMLAGSLLVLWVCCI